MLEYSSGGCMSDPTFIDSQPLPPSPQMMGFGGSSMPFSQENSTIAGMRWNGDILVLQLYKLLGNYDINITEDGTQIFERMKKNGLEVSPKINDEGLQSILGVIQAVVNPYVSLSNIRDDEANQLIKIILENIVIDIALNQEFWEIREENKTVIINTLYPVVFSQIKRSVDGWEGNNFKTQTFEQNVQQQYTQNNPNQGFSFWKPSSFNKQR